VSRRFRTRRLFSRLFQPPAALPATPSLTQPRYLWGLEATVSPRIAPAVLYVQHHGTVRAVPVSAFSDFTWTYSSSTPYPRPPVTPFSVLSPSLGLPALPLAQPHPVPRVAQPRPGVIRAQKTARLTPDRGAPFRGSGVYIRYGAKDTAQCCGFSARSYRGGEAPDDKGAHEAPHPDCSCGFHAHLHGPRLDCCGRYAWLLDVELHGRIIEHADVYRAQCQRVISVTPSRKCCASSGCLLDATVYALRDGYILPCCVRCLQAPVIVWRRQVPMPWQWMYGSQPDSPVAYTYMTAVSADTVRDMVAPALLKPPVE